MSRLCPAQSKSRDSRLPPLTPTPSPHPVPLFSTCAMACRCPRRDGAAPTSSPLASNCCFAFESDRHIGSQ